MGLKRFYKIIFVFLFVTLFLTTVVWATDPTEDSMIVPNPMNLGVAASNTSSTGQTVMAMRSLSSPAISLSQNSSSNISGIEWQDLLGGRYGETLSSIKPTDDGGYIGCGFVGSPAGDGDVTAYHNNGDVWVVKLNSTGVIQWQKSLGGNNYDQAFSINQTSDGGYILAGSTNSTNSEDVGQGHGQDDAWIVKLNSTGALQWQDVLGGSNDDVAWSIRQTTPDEGYIFSGITNATMYKGTGSVDLASRPFMGGHAWVVKLDPNGNVTWQKMFGGNGDDIANSIEQTSEGGYIFAATTSSNNSGDVGTNNGLMDIWIVKLHPSGDIQWKKMLGGTGWDFTSLWYDDGIQQTSEGGYVVIGTTTSKGGGTSEDEQYHGAGDVWVIKLDSQGNITWQNPYGGSSSDYGQSIRQTLDKGYIFAGITYSNTSGDVSQSFGNGDYWVGKLDSSGALQWQQPLGGLGYDQPETIQPTADGGYIVSGRAYSSNSGVVAEKNHGDVDAWVVKLTPRFVINVRDSDNGTYISGANVGLYDYRNNTWMNQTTQGGPVAFNGSVGANPFVFSNSSVFGLSVTADGYPTLSGNITFRVTHQTANVSLTAFNRPTIEKTFSITQVGNPGWPQQYENVSITTKANAEAISFHLLKDGWTQVFWDNDTDVTKQDFGTDGGGLDNAALHFHFGHGDAEWFGFGSSFIVLTNNSTIVSTDVKGKWGYKNKWVFLDSCEILRDDSWGSAFNGTHGIFGFASQQKSGPLLIDEFYVYATSPQYKYPLSKAFLNASKDAVHDGAIAKIIFKNYEQMETDHLPGYGPIAPDDFSNTIGVQKTQICY